MDTLERPSPDGESGSASENWLELDRSPHGIHFYSGEDLLLDSLSGFVGTALEAGDSCLVFLTPAHLDGLAERLKARGVDTDTAAKEGRYSALEVGPILARLTVNGKPDRKLFDEFVQLVILPMLAAAKSKPRRVAACGELAHLLWAEGKSDAAIELESFWNELAKQDFFSLRCIYPITSFSDPRQNELFLRLCAEHANVIPPLAGEDPLANLSGRVTRFEAGGKSTE